MAGKAKQKKSDPKKRKSVDPVARQYEALPYPERDPKDEAQRLIQGSPSDLWELNHYIFGGARDWTRPFRALIAGGGTGDGAIMLAQQLADVGADTSLLHLDISAAAQDIARRRAGARGLTNLQFRQGSILDLAADDGPFDYIDCCGVLHHLEDPLAGLTALTKVLRPDGGLGLMVYGALGRVGVYHAQQALRQLAPVDLPVADRLDHARRLVDSLPATNWLARNPFVADHIDGGDAGLYDLLLHERDRSFRVDDIFALLDSAGLQLLSFIEPIRYEPMSYLTDPKLQRRAGDLDDRVQASLAELLAGNMNRHVFYAALANATATPPDPADLSAIPILRDILPNTLAGAVSPSGQFIARQSGLEMTFSLPSLTKPILERCDGSTSLADILAALTELRTDLKPDIFKRQFAEIYRVFNGINRMHLKLA